jgi:hypothetical protein
MQYSPRYHVSVFNTNDGSEGCEYITKPVKIKKNFAHGTHPDQRVAEIGLALQLLIVKTYQFLANFISRNGADGGISKNSNE